MAAASFSPDGRRVVTASIDRTARIWDAASGAALFTLTGHEEPLRAASWSPDGSRIATASLDRTARIWDAASGELVATLEGHRDVVRGASFSPEGWRILTASRDSTARIWANAADYPAYLQARMRGRTRLCLDAGFRRDSLGEPPAEARRGAAACAACAPPFFERLGAATTSQWPAYVEAWRRYQRCYLAATGS